MPPETAGELFFPLLAAARYGLPEFEFEEWLSVCWEAGLGFVFVETLWDVLAAVVGFSVEVSGEAMGLPARVS